ncbi:hypothetical protein CDAR_435131 [Caerostris darwini]|uniref:Uncharacterized protein n=1 Tax=Caerostris darwini TaxID=1538125 RepID=A0AAV4SKU0_9ARAC|nr:hypothetical protein CDAR_435131 [Caerostris darwini]
MVVFEDLDASIACHQMRELPLSSGGTTRGSKHRQGSPTKYNVAKKCSCYQNHCVSVFGQGVVFKMKTSGDVSFMALIIEELMVDGSGGFALDNP